MTRMSTLDRLVLVRSLLLLVMVLAFIYMDTFISSGFERILGSTGTSVTNSNADRTSLTQPEQIVPLTTTRIKLSNRRFLLAELCTKSDISIFQGELTPLPSGIPTFSVQIMNLCPLDCAITNIHVACGWFASAKLINPLVFRRLTFNDCLVNDGNALDGGDSVYFEYSNSFEYPMRVETAIVCKPP